LCVVYVYAFCVCVTLYVVHSIRICSMQLPFAYAVYARLMRACYAYVCCACRIVSYPRVFCWLTFICSASTTCSCIIMSYAYICFVCSIYMYCVVAVHTSTTSTYYNHRRHTHVAHTYDIIYDTTIPAIHILYTTYQYYIHILYIHHSRTY